MRAGAYRPFCVCVRSGFFCIPALKVQQCCLQNWFELLLTKLNCHQFRTKLYIFYSCTVNNNRIRAFQKITRILEHPVVKCRVQCQCDLKHGTHTVQWTSTTIQAYKIGFHRLFAVFKAPTEMVSHAAGKYLPPIHDQKEEKEYSIV